MKQRRRYQEDMEDLNVYPAFSDLMSNAFMILSFFLMLALLQSWFLNQKLKSNEVILIDEESGKFSFLSGSYTISPKSELDNYIKNKVIKDICKALGNKYKKIDFIQVVGHTDRVPTSPNKKFKGNLDSTLLKVSEKMYQGQNEESQVISASNADLGLMRALAVIQRIKDYGQETTNKECKNIDFKTIKFRAYSAAHLYLPSGELASINSDEYDKLLEALQENPNNQEAERKKDKIDTSQRRIEIRFIPPGKRQ